MDLEEVELEVQKEVTRRMVESARADFVAFVDKVRERTMLMTMKQDMLAEEAPKAKFVDDFMVFVGAIETGDLETLRRFDQKAMMDTILMMKNRDAGDMEGLVCSYGDDVHKIGPGVEENATLDSIMAAANTDENCGGENGGFTGKNEQGGAVVDATEGPNSGGNGP
ncbi:hypothetical protein HRI_000179800 [Hibiscus trionum]|uniref:Uncharacterized protein n=1 Tax=Hibiscus trionum TaxID=183268 RepID=A0A9W7LIX5_HIBTR|nr:hypothetical protein HRI_000179800 [Hibiscus trionum]